MLFTLLAGVVSRAGPACPHDEAFSTELKSPPPRRPAPVRSLTGWNARSNLARSEVPRAADRCVKAVEEKRCALLSHQLDYPEFTPAGLVRAHTAQCRPWRISRQPPAQAEAAEEYFAPHVPAKRWECCIARGVGGGRGPRDGGHSPAQLRLLFSIVVSSRQKVQHVKRLVSILDHPRHTCVGVPP